MINTFKKYFLVLMAAFTLAISVLIPIQAQAQTASTSSQCEELRKQITNGGGGDIINTLPSYCTPGAVYNKFINLAFYFLGIVGVISLIYGGYLYMTAGGNADQAKQARSVLKSAVIGIAVVLLAAVIVNLVVKSLVENSLV